MKQLILPLAMALCACQPSAETADAEGDNVQTEAANEAVADNPARDLQGFANAAAASDAFEIASSELALQKAQSAEIKQFAQMMIDGHRASTDKLKSALAGMDGAPAPDPTLTAEQELAMEQLRAASGAAFDQAYAAAQVDGHQKALALLETQASADGNPLSGFAKEMVPVVSEHLEMAKQLNPQR